MLSLDQLATLTYITKIKLTWDFVNYKIITTEGVQNEIINQTSYGLALIKAVKLKDLDEIRVPTSLVCLLVSKIKPLFTKAALHDFIFTWHRPTNPIAIRRCTFINFEIAYSGDTNEKLSEFITHNRIARLVTWDDKTIDKNTPCDYAVIAESFPITICKFQMVIYS